MLRHAASLIMALSVGAEVLADGAAVSGAVADRNDPGFVRAVVLECGPGGSFYGCAGHIAIRLTCPYHKLDEVFSYESEPVRNRVLRFFAGRLKMGMFAIPYDEFLRDYRQEGRGVWQHELNLSPAAKVRLWKLMDDRVAEGADLPYDYIHRGCAQAALLNLMRAIAPEPLTAEKPAKSGQTRRDIIEELRADFPWVHLIVNLTTGPAADRMVRATDSVILPKDFIGYLRGMRVGGEPVLIGEPIELQPQTHVATGLGRVLSPMACSAVLLLLAVVGCFVATRPIHGTLILLQAVLSLFESYVSLVSELPAAAWNVLLVPFNLLPFVLWPWRRLWCLPYVVVLLAWCAWMLISTHRLTDPAMVVLAFSLVVVYAKMGCQNTPNGNRTEHWFGR